MNLVGADVRRLCFPSEIHVSLLTSAPANNRGGSPPRYMLQIPSIINPHEPLSRDFHLPVYSPSKCATIRRECAPARCSHR